MIKNLYVLYDKIAEEAGPILEAKNDGVAVRHAQSVFKNNPVIDVTDYKLLSIGYIDTQTAKITISELVTEVPFIVEVEHEIE